MIRSKRVQIAFILVFVLTAFAFGQDKQDEQDKQLREEILLIYKSKGEQGLRDFMKKKKDKISNKFIIDLAKTGENEREEEWLKACIIMAEETHDQKTIAYTLYHTGEYYRLISNNDKAFDYYEKVIDIFSGINDPVGQGKGYVGKGKLFSYIGRNAEALELYNKALLYFEKVGDPLGQGDVYLNKGVVYFNIGDYTAALEMYAKAVPFYEKTGKYLGQAQIYWRKGDIYSYTGNFSTALDMYKKALPLYEKEGDSLGQGNVYLSIGEIYLMYGDFSKTLEMCDKALFFFAMARSPLSQGTIYDKKGDVYFLSGDYSSALEMYDKAMLIFVKVGTLLGQGNVYLSKGTVYFHSGDNGKAINMYEKALSFYKKAADMRGQGHVYYSKGKLYLRIGDNKKALKMYEKAMPFYEKLDDPLGQGVVCQGKGAIHLNIGDLSRALEMNAKAQFIFEKMKYPLEQGNVALQKGEIYFKAGDFSRAQQMFEKSLFFFEKTKDHLGLGNVYKCMGNIYLKTEDYPRASVMYEKAFTFYTAIGDLESQADILFKKALIFERQGKKIKSLDLLEKVIHNLEKVRMQMAFSEIKRTFMGNVYQQYDETVLFMLENQYYEKGFKYAEAMRARVFLDRMTEGLVRPDKGLTIGMKKKRDKLAAQLSYLSKDIHRTVGGKDEKKLQDLKIQYRKVENEFEDLLIKIRLANPLYAEVNYPQPVSVKDLQKGVLKEGEILLSYFISQERSYAFIISKDNFTVKQLKVKENEIKGLVDRYLPAVKENNLNDMKRYGSLLYQKLFKPLEKYLDKNNEIIIVPMGELETIPFESLVIDKKKTGRPVYLLEKYRVKYVQGASLLSFLRKYYTRDGTSKRFIGFGDPVYDYESFKQSKPEQGSVTRSPGEENSVADEIKEIHRDRYARAGGIMNRLPQSGEEIQTIARLFEKESLESVTHLREQASEANAKAANMKDFAYIHFSCHGLLSDDFQSLVLSQLPPDKSSEDGYFTLNEIMNCDYNAKLVVLSACQTGSGKMYRGEGVTGLTRAVMYAGTPAVVASLWDVDDRATKELMVRFYRNMLEKNMDKEEALRMAKLDLINGEKYASPYYWSAFIMYGE